MQAGSVGVPNSPATSAQNRYGEFSDYKKDSTLSRTRVRQGWSCTCNGCCCKSAKPTDQNRFRKQTKSR